MRLGIVLVALAAGLLVMPHRSEPGHPRAAEGYAARAVGVGLLELPVTVVPGEPLGLVRDGRRRAEVGALDVAVAMPGAVVAAAMAGHGDALAAELRASFGALLSVFLFAAIGAVFHARLHRRRALGMPAGRALLATLALLLSTGLLLGARRADASLLAALAMLLLVDRVGVEGPPRGHALHVGLLAGLLVVAQPACTGAAVGLVLLDVLRRRRALFALALVPVAVAHVLAHAWDASVALPPMPNAAWGHALYGLLLSPGRSVFVYSPLAALGVIAFQRLWARDRHRAEAIAVASVMTLLGIAVRADWHGEPSYGPPLVLPLVPLLAEAAALVLDGGRAARLVFAGVALAGMLVQGLGLAVRAEAWPRFMGDVRVATGAPGWFLQPTADLSFVPQLSPVVGHALLLRAQRGRPAPALPPFALVVGSDQVEPGKGQGMEVIWAGLWAKLDRSTCRPNLALTEGPPLVARAQLALALLFIALGTVAATRAYARDRRVRWPTG